LKNFHANSRTIVVAGAGSPPEAGPPLAENSQKSVRFYENVQKKELNVSSYHVSDCQGALYYEVV